MPKPPQLAPFSGCTQRPSRMAKLLFQFSPWINTPLWIATLWFVENFASPCDFRSYGQFDPGRVSRDKLVLGEGPDTEWWKKRTGVGLASPALEPGLGRGSRESAWWLHLRPCLKKQSRPKPPYRVQDYVTEASIVGAGPIGQILQLLKLAIGRKSKSIKNYTNILIISIDHK